MLFHLQFKISLDDFGSGLAWPRDDKSGRMWLVDNPLDSIGYGSEAAAIGDLDRWLTQIPFILEAEVVQLPIDQNA
jgi:hypothetical protein